MIAESLVEDDFTIFSHQHLPAGESVGTDAFIHDSADAVGQALLAGGIQVAGGQITQAQAARSTQPITALKGRLVDRPHQLCFSP